METFDAKTDDDDGLKRRQRANILRIKMTRLMGNLNESDASSSSGFLHWLTHPPLTSPSWLGSIKSENAISFPWIYPDYIRCVSWCIPKYYMTWWNETELMTIPITKGLLGSPRGTQIPRMSLLAILLRIMKWFIQPNLILITFLT